MSERIDQVNLTIELAKKHHWQLFKVHTLAENSLCSCGAFKCTSQGKHPVYKDWKTGPFLDKIHEFVVSHGDKNLLTNIGIKTGGGFAVIDIDSEEAYFIFKKDYPLLTNTLTSKTSKGYHLFFRTKEEIRNKIKIKDSIDIRGENGFVVGAGSIHLSGFLYKWINPESVLLDFPLDFLMNSKKTSTTNNDERTLINVGGRNDFLFKEACRLKNLELSDELSIELLSSLNNNFCNPPLEENELFTLFNSSKNYSSTNIHAPQFDIEKLHGPLGKTVKKISPFTEASPIAIYTQLLTILGNYFGRIVYSEVSGDRHFTNIMSLIVGNSAIARKGTSLGVAIAVLKKIIPEYIESNIKSGATSAEGIIYHNRDPIFETKNIKGRAEKICVDLGVTDKRLMIIETEFGSVLISMKREGNKLSTVMRDIYDSKNLSTLSKNNSVKSTNPHISFIAHITIDELNHLLSSVDIFNGFGNRFLFIYTSTDKILPEAPAIDEIDLKADLSELSKSISHWDQALNSIFGIKITFSKDAQLLWNSKYEAFSKNPEKGVIGTLLNRNLIHAKKIATILAMLDKKTVIEKEHLESALYVTNFAQESVKFIFKDKKETLSFKQKKVIAFLESRLMNKASRSEISKSALQRNSTSKEIEQIKNELVENKLITTNKSTGNEVWELL